MTPEEIAALRATAQEATPGPWRLVDWTAESSAEVRAAPGKGRVARDTSFEQKNARYLALLSPERVLSLLDALDLERRGRVEAQARARLLDERLSLALVSGCRP